MFVHQSRQIGPVHSSHPPQVKGSVGLRVADAEVGAAGPLVDGGLGAADPAAPVLADWRVALEAALDGKGEREEGEHCSLICARRAGGK